MSSSVGPDKALLDRLARVLHDMGLPCACQEEVERTVAIFAEYEERRSKRRLLRAARDKARQIASYVEYLDDIEVDDPGPDEIAAAADVFRVLASVAAEGAASLEMLLNRKLET